MLLWGKTSKRVLPGVRTSAPLSHPLLGQDGAMEEPPPGLSNMGLTMNLTTTILGTTVLGIAAQMKRGGWIMTPVMLCAAGAVIAEMTWLVSATTDVLRCKKGIVVRTYQDFAEGALGKYGRILASVTSTGDLLVYMFIALLLESENMQCTIPISWRWFGQEGGGREWWSVILSSTTVLYCFVDLAPLVRFSAMVGPSVCCLMVLLVWAGSLQAALEMPQIPAACRKSNDGDYWSRWPTEYADGNTVFHLASVQSYCFFCFAVVATLPSVQSTMREPSKLGSAGARAFALTSAIFVSIMVVAYWGFGNQGPENLIEGMRVSRPAGWWATTRPWESGSTSLAGRLLSVATTASMLLVDATYVPCAAMALEGIAQRCSCRKRSVAEVAANGIEADLGRCSRLVNVVIRLGLVAVRLLVAVGVSSFIALSGFTASLFCMANNVLIPIAAFYRSGAADGAGVPRKVAHAVVLVFAVGVVVIGTYNATEAILFPSKADAQAAGIFPRGGLSKECEAAYHNAVVQ